MKMPISFGLNALQQVLQQVQQGRNVGGCVDYFETVPRLRCGRLPLALAELAFYGVGFLLEWA